jgi:hypothetical protein
MKKILAFTILFPLLYSSQVGINNATPSSTLAVSGSIEGNYREVTATDVLTKNDYHVSFAGSTPSILVLPTMSTTDNTESDFRGRKYYLKQQHFFKSYVNGSLRTDHQSGGSTSCYG